MSRPRPLLLLVVALAALVLAVPRAARSAGPVQNPANGHWYEAIRRANPLSFADASLAAQSSTWQGRPGHLATVTSSSEQAFITPLLSGNSVEGFWLGGLQPLEGVETSGDWRWVTGEPWVYANWNPGEPNDSDGNSDYTACWVHGRWDDTDVRNLMIGYVVEYEPAPVGIPGDPDRLSATLVSSTRTDVAWVDASQNETGFEIERKLGGGAFQKIATVGANASSYQDTGLPANTLFTYRVRAVNGIGASDYSNEATPGFITPRPILNPANGHWYQAVTALADILPATARTQAATMSWHGAAGHLLTLTSQEENDFLLTPFRDALRAHYLAGGIQDPAGPEPGGGWGWVTGEPWVFANWNTGEPNDFERNSNVLNLWDNGRWNDHWTTGPIGGFFVEYEVAPGAPNPPSGLTATALSATQVRLNWSDASGDETGFEIERRTAAGGYSLQTTVGANVTSFVDPSVAPVTSYVYRARAVNALGGSTYSNEAAVTTPAIPPPTAPSLLKATAGSASRIDLSWSDNSPDESGFEVERRLGDGAYSVLARPGPNTVSLADTAVDPGTQYTYRVRAVGAGGPSGYSDEATATTPGLPPPPPFAPLGLVLQVVSSRRIDLTWLDNSVNEGSFEIERKTGSAAFAPVAGVGADVTAYSDVDLQPATSYTYRVRAVNGSGASGYTNEATATTLPLPPAPPDGLVVTSVAQTSLRLRWNDRSSTEIGFHVERKTGSGDFARVGAIGGGVTTFQDQGLALDTLYTYRVRSWNNGGESAPLGRGERDHAAGASRRADRPGRDGDLQLGGQPHLDGCRHDRDGLQDRAQGQRRPVLRPGGHYRRRRHDFP